MLHNTYFWFSLSFNCKNSVNFFLLSWNNFHWFLSSFQSMGLMCFLPVVYPALCICGQMKPRTLLQFSYICWDFLCAQIYGQLWRKCHEMPRRECIIALIHILIPLSSLNIFIISYFWNTCLEYQLSCFSQGSFTMVVYHLGYSRSFLVFMTECR